MSDASDNPDMSEVLRLVLRHWFSRAWTALPGVIETYDPETQRADVAPAVVPFLPLTEGEEPERLAVIPNVPVVMPSGGGFFASFPMQKGDPVLLVICCRDIGPWKAGNGEVKDCADNRMHDLTDAYAIPGGMPSGKALGEVDGSSMVVGKDGGHQVRIGDGVIDIGTSGGAKQAVALAEKTKSEVESLASSFNSFVTNTWGTFVTSFGTFVTQVLSHTHVEGAAYQVAPPPATPNNTQAPAGISPAVASPGTTHGAVNDVGSGSVNAEE